MDSYYTDIGEPCMVRVLKKLEKPHHTVFSDPV